eukprot:PITA_02345
MEEPQGGRVEAHVQECEACQRNKGELIHLAGLLQPLPIPEGKWESISTDFITGIPIVQGKDYIYVVVDRLTKYAHFFAIPTRYLASQVAELLFREIFRLHGLAKNIMSDRDSRLMGGFWQELCRLVGTELTPSTSYHPQTNGQTEVVRRVGEVAYELELPPGSRIHNIFHVSCIKKVLGQQVTTAVELPLLDDEGHLVLEPAAILERRERKLRSRTIKEFWVCWNNLPDEDDT